jgi:hypothetical protein
MRRALWVVGTLALLLMAGYFIAVALVRKKIETALHSLPAGITVSYSSLHLRLLNGTISLEDVLARAGGQSVTLKKLTLDGIRYAALLHHRLQVRDIRVDGCSVDIGEDPQKMALPEIALPFEAVSMGRVEIGGMRVRMAKYRLSLEGELKLDSLAEGSGKWGIGGIYLLASRIKGVLPGGEEMMMMDGVTLDSRSGELQIDTVRIRPTEEKEEIGRRAGYQVDVLQSTTAGVVVGGLDLRALMKRHFVASRVSIRHNEIYVFRDRRLPLKTGEKPLPVEGLESIPVTLRVGSVSLGSSFFEYEEHPKLRKETGVLKIYRLHGTMTPLINHPRSGDPDYLTMQMEGSLMNSGTVTATTKLPLHKGDPYKVEGTFHELDVTSLNNPAENLGHLHLESGMLNSLDFRFDMTAEGSTGQIVGEYHDLVADELKEKSEEKKVDKLKSFALKKFIIPRNKDKSLPVRKRTGKVNYKRDKERYFSYYLLHSLLVGVKSSFTLGFLLPG